MTEYSNKTMLTGGGKNALDGLSIDDISNGDTAVLMIGSVELRYTYDDTSTLEEDPPEVVTPNDRAGIGAWLLSGYGYDADSTATLTNKTIDADNNTISNLEHGAEVDNLSSGVHGVTGSIVGTSDTQTLTNKTIDAASNTISNIGDSQMTTGIDAAKVADGTVSNAEFQYLNGVTSAIQTQIDNTRLITHVTKDATADLTADNVSSTIVTNYGQAAECTLTLPAAAQGLNAIFQIATIGTAFHIKAGASDKIYLDGTALDDGDKASCATTAVGDYIRLWAFQTGASEYDWIAESGQGTWTDGGV